MNQLKQKNYRDFTIGELLDAGLKIDVKSHHRTREENKMLASKFEGAKQSERKLNEELSVVSAWKKSFEFIGYVAKEDEVNA